MGLMKGVLLDLDGVLYVGDAAVPGAADAVGWLRDQDVELRFLTNTTSRPRRAVVERLRAWASTPRTRRC
jgi:ribonucleotide monophosphatase NagD (HAD superfamily)